MRSLGVLLLSALAALLIAGAVQLTLAEWYGSREEFILVWMGLIVLVLTVMVVFGIAVGTGARKGTITRIALGFAAILVLALAGIEIAAIWQGGRASLSSDMPILVEIAAPGLLAIAIQWWFLHRHVKQKAALKNG